MRRSSYLFLIAIVSVLCIAGLVMVLSASSVDSLRSFGTPWSYFERQAAYLPAVVPSLHRLVAVMSLYLEDLAPCDEIEAAGRTDLHVWERAVVDAGAALRIAADCLHRSAIDLCASEPVSEPVSRRVPPPSWSGSHSCDTLP